MPRPDSNRTPRRVPRDLLGALAIAAVFLAALAATRPRFLSLSASQSRSDAQRATCLSNLGRIAQGYALYASDWDGAFPRGVDAEDRYASQVWRGQRGDDGRDLFQAVQSAPMLFEVLKPYQVPRNAWHCPSDVGFSVSRLQNLNSSQLRNVHPSVWRKYGLSYFYLTSYGLQGKRAGQLKSEAGRTLILFDGDYWHADASGTPNLAGAMFADGHARMTTPREFDAYLRR